MQKIAVPAVVIVSWICLAASCSQRSPSFPSELHHKDCILEAAVAEVTALPLPQGVDPELFQQLKSEFIRTITTIGVKQTAAPPTGDWNEIKDFRVIEDPPGTWYLEWTYVNTGDNDLNSEVNISDITPIGAYYGAKVGDADWDSAQVADADANGEVNISDITAVGINFMNYVKEYHVYSSSAIEDHPALNEGENGPGAGMLGIVTYEKPGGASSLRQVSASAKPTMSFALTGDPGTKYFWVRPVGQDVEDEGSESIAGGGNPVELPVLNLLNPPPEGSGQINDPYQVETGVPYSLTLSDPVDGDVTLDQNTEFILSDKYAGAVEDGVLLVDSRYTGDFTVNATYQAKPAKRDSVLYCSAVAPTPPESHWPTFGHDAQRTGRSPVTGPQSSNIAWDHDSGEAIYYSSPVVGADGTVFIGSGGFGDQCNLIAVKPDGTRKWTYFTNYSLEWTSAVISPDSTVYIGDFGHRLHAVDAVSGEGTVLYRADNPYHGGPVVDDSGMIYICSGGDLLAVNPDGTLAWTYTTDNLVRTSPALGRNGGVFIGGDDGKLHAVSSGGGAAWTYDTGYPVRSTPAVGADGAIYFTNDDYKLFVLESDGSERWIYELATLAMVDDNPVKSSPALGIDGTVYVGVPRTSSDTTMGSVHAVNPIGTRKWITYISGEVYASPALGADGTVYISTEDGLVYALDNDGNEKWHALLGVAMNSSPAIGPDGHLFVGCANNRLYCFGSVIQ